MVYTLKPEQNGQNFAETYANTFPEIEVAVFRFKLHEDLFNICVPKHWRFSIVPKTDNSSETIYVIKLLILLVIKLLALYFWYSLYISIKHWMWQLDQNATNLVLIQNFFSKRNLS